MRNIRTMGLCLVAVFAISVVTAATASAANPVFLQCAKVAEPKLEGIFKTSICTEEVPQSNVPPPEYIRATMPIDGIEPGIACQKNVEHLRGTWNNKICEKKVTHETGEFNRVFTRHIFVVSGGAGTLETKGGSKVKCTSNEAEGEYTGEKTVGKIKVIFKGCESLGFKCNTKEAAAGEIRTNELKGEIGYLVHNEKTKETKVGLLLEPTVEKGLFAEFNCAAEIVKVKVEGAVIGELKKGINEMAKEGELLYEQSKGVQKWTKFEGGAEKILKTSKNGGAFEQSAIEGKDTIKAENGKKEAQDAVEIVA